MQKPNTKNTDQKSKIEPQQSYKFLSVVLIFDFLSLISGKSRKQRNFFGYTIIELLVTIGIFSLISSIVLVNYPKLSEQLSVSQTAHEIALAFREAKTYALAVRQFGGSYQVGYGVHFDKATPENFILYAAPLNTSNKCNSGVNCVRGSVATYDVDTFTMKSGIQIMSICDTTTGTICYEKLDVAYVRPDPIVYIIGTDVGGTPSPQSLTSIRIKVRTPGGQEKSIDIWSTGQISVQ
jgi:type II secretory pathway pseudopilin PulG